MHVKGMLSLGAALFAAVAMVSSSGAGTAASRSANRIDVSTRASVIHYLRSIHVNPRGVVIQRGTRNYAGPKCPGAGWTCTSTTHPVVQVASAGGRNSFTCSGAHCAVVQAGEAPQTVNTAKCIKTSGITQSCSINQTSASADNLAIVYMSAVKTTGLTQNASQTAQIVQRATGGETVHNNNRACVTQYIRLDTSTVAPRGMPVVATLDGHQTLVLEQDSRYGNNVATESANGSSGGSCGTFVDPADPLHVPHPNINQLQTIKQTATGSARVEQYENTHDQGPNLSLDVKQNQNGGGEGPNNTNDAIFSQNNALTAIAKTPIGPVVQTQGTANGGLLASVNQFAHGHSNADAHQTEIQCEHATGSGALNCITGGTVQYNQTQHGPVRKSPGDSLQSGNEDCSPTCDSFTVTQSSTQDNDTHAGQTNLVEAGFSTDGSGMVDQTTTVNGDTTHTTESGQNVESSINCSGSSCTISGGNANVLIAGTGDIGNPEPNDNLTQLLTNAGYAVTESATLPADLSSFGQVWWVDSNPPTSNEQNQLIAFAQSGNGVFLTGERPCCEALNAADQTIVNSVVTGGGITVGGQGDVCGCNAPLPVNPTVVGSVATQPFTVTTWTPAAPGGMANVPASSVFSYYEPDPPTQQVVAAVWDRPSLVGNGRLVVFMDINWPEVAWRAANWSDVAQNVAFFLSGLSSPPGSPVVSGANIASLAPALSVGRAQATPARVPATASGGSTR